MKSHFIFYWCLTFVFCAAGLRGQQWSAISPFPGVATDGAFSFVIGDTAYVGGGLMEDHFYAYDATADQWIQLADVPSPGNHLAWAFSFSANGKGYVVGGAYQSASDLAQETWEYDPAADTWTKKADFPPGPRDAGFSFSVGGKAYIGGGFDGQFVHSDMYEYDPVADQWTQKAYYPEGAVIFPVAFVVNGEAYVGTGGGKGGNSGDEMQNLWKYDPGTDSWSKRADFAGAKRQAAVALSIGNRAYVGGGMSGYSTVRQDFWEYDPVQNSWTQVQNADLPMDRVAWSVAFALDGKGYFGTGADLPGINTTRNFYSYDFGLTREELPEKPDFTISPVPVRSSLYLEYPADLRINGMRVFDLTGRKIRDFAPDLQVLPTADLKPGMYVLELSTSSGIFREQFIKQ